MKLIQIIRKRPYIILFALLLLTFGSCNTEDDVVDILTGKTWYLKYFYTTSNWEDNNISKPLYPESQENQLLETINGPAGTSGDLNRFYIIFNTDHTFRAVGLGDNQFSGKWEADGKDKTLNFYNITSPGDFGNTNIFANQISKVFYDRINAAGFYRGDNTMYLKIFAEDKKSYMHFGPKR